MAVKYLDNAGTQYLVNKIKAIDGKIPTESQITTMITSALNTYKEGIVTIVESLPKTGEEGKLYLMVDPSDSDVYIIYTWEENAFKRMGSKTFTLTVDSALSSTSTNPVQNKVIKTALDGKANSSHTHGSITNDGKLGTASRVVITGTDKKIGISSVTTTELGYLSGVTSSIQTQLDGKSATGHTHTAGDVAGLATVATSGSYNDLSNKPTINDSTITIQKNGSTVDTFTTNGSNKTINIPVPTKTSDLTNDSGFLTSTDISSKANDSEVLHKAQTETVTGEKTFKKDIKIIDLNANERPGVKFEVNGSFRTFEDAKDALPDTDSGDFGVGTVWSAFWLDDNTKIQNSMSDYVINDITFGTTNYGSVIELNNYYKVKYEEADNIQTDLRGMLRFELVPYAGVQKDSEIWTEPKLYFYAKLENDEFGDTILGHEYAHWSKAYINEINCYEIKFGGNSIHDILEHIVSLSYVTHYSSTALTSNSTNSLSIIDNQDSVKVNDKVIDSSGKMFYITSIDHRNDEFEVGNVVDTFAKDSAVSTAQATANSAQQTATTARQQSYVFRYSSTALTASSTNSNTLLDNTDNLKVGDKVIDSNGVLFSITAIDTQNSTFTIGTALIDLALDANVVHTSGVETISGIKSFADIPIFTSFDGIRFRCAHNSNAYVTFRNVGQADAGSIILSANDGTTGTSVHLVNKTFVPYNNNDTDLGSGSKSWKDLYGYHGYFRGQQQGDEYSGNARTNLTLTANRDTVGQSGIVFDTFRENTTQGTGSHILGIGMKENSVRYEGCRFSWLYDDDNNGYVFALRPTKQGTNQPIKYELGNSSSKWSTINGINPGALSLPDLDNGIDISGYITAENTHNEYTPLVDGWISVILKKTTTSGALAIFLYQGDVGNSYFGNTPLPNETEFCGMASIPVKAGSVVNIDLKGSNTYVYSAKFYPNLGNV